MWLYSEVLGIGVSMNFGGDTIQPKKIDSGLLWYPVAVGRVHLDSMGGKINCLSW